VKRLGHVWSVAPRLGAWYLFELRNLKQHDFQTVLCRGYQRYTPCSPALARGIVNDRWERTTRGRLTARSQASSATHADSPAGGCA